MVWHNGIIMTKPLLIAIITVTDESFRQMKTLKSFIVFTFPTSVPQSCHKVTECPWELDFPLEIQLQWNMWNPLEGSVELLEKAKVMKFSVSFIPVTNEYFAFISWTNLKLVSAVI